MSTPELKPCPFCGSIAHMRREPCADGAGYFAYIQCNGCRSRSSETYYSTGNDCPQLYQGRRDAWNTRTDTILSDPRVKALVEALEKALNFIANTESEMGETLPSGDAARAALASMKEAKE